MNNGAQEQRKAQTTVYTGTYFIFIMFSFLFYLFFRFNNKLLPSTTRPHNLRTVAPTPNRPRCRSLGANKRVVEGDVNMRRGTRDVHPRLELPLFFLTNNMYLKLSTLHNESCTHNYISIESDTQAICIEGYTIQGFVVNKRSFIQIKIIS